MTSAAVVVSTYRPSTNQLVHFRWIKSVKKQSHLLRKPLQKSHLRSEFPRQRTLHHIIFGVKIQTRHFRSFLNIDSLTTYLRRMSSTEVDQRKEEKEVGISHLRLHFFKWQAWMSPSNTRRGRDARAWNLDCHTTGIWKLSSPSRSLAIEVTKAVGFQYRLLTVVYKNHKKCHFQNSSISLLYCFQNMWLIGLLICEHISSLNAG